jgi:hypothetical protein
MSDRCGEQSGLDGITGLTNGIEVGKQNVFRN